MPPESPPEQTLPSLIRTVLERPRDQVLLERTNGVWTAFSNVRLLERIENVACAIRDSGLDGGDRIALVAHNCVDWIVCDFATLLSGCVVVPIYPTQALDHTAYILTHSEAKLIFVDSTQTRDHLRASGATLPHVVILDSQGADGLAAFESQGAAIRAQRPELPAAYTANAQPGDLAVLIYTSGTTGQPKGVMLSHDNIAFDAHVSLACGFEGLDADRTVISVLPYSHIYEHTVIYIYLLAGVRYYICHDPGELLADLRDVRPAEMTAVPRIFERVLAGINGQARRAGGAQARLVPWALGVGRKYMHAKVFHRTVSPWLSLQYAIASRVVLQNVRARLGLDRVRFLTSGSAPLHVDTAMTFLGLGVPVMQGYGLTETSPVVSVSSLTANEYGAVGRPITGVDVRIADDGEVLVRGRNVMQGYYRDPASTAQVLDGEWLLTGDVGEIDAAGFLRITDRKREVFKTDTGKWVSPARVEANIKRSLYVAQVMVTGLGRPYPIALVCPNWSLLRLELPALPADATPEALSARDDVRKFLTAEVHRQTADLASYEQVRGIIVVPEEFTVEGGELSPSMKVKRRVVEARYSMQIDRAYQRL